jgi:hypothetical protein
MLAALGLGVPANCTMMAKGITKRSPLRQVACPHFIDKACEKALNLRQINLETGPLFSATRS